jgi:hypothetical protein
MKEPVWTEPYEQRARAVDNRSKERLNDKEIGGHDESSTEA